MKTTILILFNLVGSLAFARNVMTTVECTSSNGRFSGSKSLLEDRQNFNARELKDILLKERQTNEATFPYPVDIVVSPEVRDLQSVDVRPQLTTSLLKNSYYFTLYSANFTELPVFCIVTQARGPCPPADMSCKE